MKLKSVLSGIIAVFAVMLCTGCLPSEQAPNESNTASWSAGISAEDTFTAETSVAVTVIAVDTREESSPDFSETPVVFDTDAEETLAPPESETPAEETLAPETPAEETEVPPESETEAPHEHRFASDWSHDDGGHWHAAVCTHEVIADYAVHRSDAGQLTTPATCTTDGVCTFICMDCGRIIRTESVPARGHEETPAEAVLPTCTETGLSAGSHCGVCGETLIEQTEVPATGHTESPIAAVEPTCTETGLSEGSQCTACGEILIPQVEADVTGHTPSDTRGHVLPTWEKEGGIDSVSCLACSEVLVAGRALPALSEMNGRYGYEALRNMEDGDALQRFYERFDEAVVAFHTDTTRNADAEGRVADVDFSSLGLHEDQALMVWVTYKSDNPLFYWLSTEILYSTERLYILTDSLYADGHAREACNTLIVEQSLDLMIALFGKLDALPAYIDPAYKTAEFFHDTIIKNMDYAYENDGVTPQDDLWAHNIMGYFKESAGVCESYARTFQLLMNYSGVECLYVMGMANGGGHAWNLSRMGNGGWYWFDLTWDDQPTRPGGMIDDYFCVTDTEGANFLSTHTPFASEEIGINHQYPLPDRSERRHMGILITGG